MVQSFVTGRMYDPNKSVRIINMQQLAAYMANGVTLLDIYISKDYKTERPILVGIVDKEESYESYKLWCDHRLD